MGQKSLRIQQWDLNTSFVHRTEKAVVKRQEEQFYFDCSFPLQASTKSYRKGFLKPEVSWVEQIKPIQKYGFPSDLKHLLGGPFLFHLTENTSRTAKAI